MHPVRFVALVLVLTDVATGPLPFDPDGGPRRRLPPRIDTSVPPQALAAARMQILRTARAEARRIERTQATALAGASWVNLGPTDGIMRYQGSVLGKVGSGRGSTIRVDPRNPDVVYLATAGGGVWKSFDFSAAEPTWHPITELLGTMQVGAIDLDPQNPDTIFLGIGDFLDGLAGAVVRSRDGGRTWDDPVALGFSSSVRDLRVDPSDGHIILAATNLGLYRSTDGGDHFDLIDLPNPGPMTLSEGTWSLAYLGAGHWMVSGVQACDHGRDPPHVGYGLPAGTSCRLGNLGDLWRSADDGATWTSARVAGALPIPTGELGRMTLAAGNPADPAHTVVYAWAETADEGLGGTANTTADILRSTDGGATWASARGTLSNPIVIDGSPYDCRDMNLGHNQSWYNQAIAVDPSNDANAIIGGQQCGMRTTNGTAASPTWDNVSFPEDYPVLGCGSLTSVHPDWHAAMVLPSGRVLAATDGGLYTADGVFAVARGQECAIGWIDHNQGVVSHQFYALASGDPVAGNPDMTYASAQDNGTLYRSGAHPTEFDMMSFGDGVGSVATPEIEWLSTFSTGTEAQRFYCKPAEHDCSADLSWTEADPTEPSGDATGFIARFAAAADPGGVVLSYSNRTVWRSDASGPTWEAIGTFSQGIENVAASQTTAQLYGVLLSDGHTAVTSDGGATWTTSAMALGIGPATNQRMRGATSLAFPPGGNGDLYVAASNAPALDNGAPVPDAIGHIFVTRDRGMTFTPLGGHGLPNVPIEVVRFDPGDAMTLYAGTEIGVYRSQDGGASWSRLGEGLPMVRVTDLYIAKNSSLLRVSTFGRGIWEIYPTATPRGVPGDGDFDRNGQLDFVDLAAMTARLGTTPATAQAPYYSWYCDMTGDGNAIDDADLSALLDRFGGHP